MKVFIVLSAFIVMTLAQHYAQHQHQSQQHQPQAPPRPHIPIVKSESHQNHDGSYQFGYETANGIQAKEQGYIKNAGVKDGEIQVQQGFYSYTDTDGHPISVQYIADENGFQAQGAHFPTPPPLPKALEEAYAKHAQEHQQLPQYEEEPHHQQQYYKKY